MPAWGRALRDCVRRVGAFAAALALAACGGNVTVGPTPTAVTTGPSLYQWQLVHGDDAIFGAGLIATLPMGSNLNLLTGETRSGFLDLRCFKNKPVVLLRFDYKVGSNTSAGLSYRFDDKGGVEAKARFLRNYSTIVIDDPSEVRRFVSQLATASRLLMRVDSLMVAGTHIALDVRGGGYASEQALANCPLPPVVADRRT